MESSSSGNEDIRKDGDSDCEGADDDPTVPKQLIPNPARLTRQQVEQMRKQDELEFPKNTATKSTVWDKFTLVGLKATGKLLPFACCQKCKAFYAFQSSHVSGTTALKKHSTACESNLRKGGQLKLTSFLPKTSQAKVVPRTAKNLMTEACVNFVVSDLRSFRTIAGSGFQSLVTQLLAIGNQYGVLPASELLPHPTTVSRNIEVKARELRDKLKPELLEAFSFTGPGGGATLDFWTDDQTQTAYVGLTIHYLKEWRLVERILLITEYDAELSKTGENIRSWIVQRLKEFDISEEMCQNIIFTTDGAPNVIKAYNIASRLPMIRVTCAAHLCNTVQSNAVDPNKGSDSIDVVLGMVDLSKKLVAHFKHCGLMRLLGKSLKQEVATRWNTILALLLSILEEYDTIVQILDQRNEGHLMPGPEDLMQETADFLKPFKDATVEWSASKVPTMHRFIPIFGHLETLCKGASEHAAVADFKTQVLKYLNEKVKPTLVHKIAYFLDPAYRKLRLFPEAERKVILAEVRRLLPKPIAVPSVAVEPTPKRLKSSFDLGKYADVANLQQPGDELKRYQGLRIMDVFENPLDFWKKHEKEFPGLTAMAKKYLAAPVTSTPSERLFSSAGFVLDEKRNSLNPTKVDDILFLYSNLNQ